MSRWLLDRLYAEKDQPTARFAFNGTVNWMRALSFIVESSDFSDETIKSHYSGVSKRSANPSADTDAFESLLMSLQYVAGIAAMNGSTNKSYSFVRLAIISWYYSIYNASSAMISAYDGTKQEAHKKTSKVWHNMVVANLVMSPFNLRIDDLRTKEVEVAVCDIRSKNEAQGDLSRPAKSKEEAFGAMCSYLIGTARYEQESVEEWVKDQKVFKDLGVKDFRTAKARELKNDRLQKEKINFLTQAIRYRGKANYRDSIYLAYGDNMEERIETFINDLERVSSKFLRMASYYVSRRVERGTWSEFVSDLDQNTRFSIGKDIIHF